MAIEWATVPILGAGWIPDSIPGCRDWTTYRRTRSFLLPNLLDLDRGSPHQHQHLRYYISISTKLLLLQLLLFLLLHHEVRRFGVAAVVYGICGRIIITCRSSRRTSQAGVLEESPRLAAHQQNRHPTKPTLFSRPNEARRTPVGTTDSDSVGP